MLPRWPGRRSTHAETNVEAPPVDEAGFSLPGLVLTVMVFVAFAAFEDVLSEILEARLGLPSLVGAVTAGGLMATLLLPVQRLSRRVAARRVDDASSPRQSLSPPP